MHCPKCLETMNITDWRPDKGFDAELREFECPRCKEFIYRIPRGFEQPLKG